MAKRKTDNIKYKNHESISNNEKFGRVSDSMRRSKAFKSLSKRQIWLLLLCKRQMYSGNKPINDYQAFNQSGKIHDDDFYLNWALVTKSEDAIYKETESTPFRRDIKALIEKGFIECVESGRATKKRNVYRMSPDWKFWKPTEKPLADGNI